MGFIDGNITTKFIEEEYPDGFKRSDINLETRNFLLITSSLLRLQNMDNTTFVITIDEQEDVWRWTINCRKKDTQVELKIDGQTLLASLEYDSLSTVVQVHSNQKHEILQVLENKEKSSYVLQYKGHKYNVDVRTPSEEEEFQKLPKPIKIDHTKMLFAPMPGKILKLSIKIGQKIEKDQEVCVIEAMKMQNVFKAAKGG